MGTTSITLQFDLSREPVVHCYYADFERRRDM